MKTCAECGQEKPLTEFYRHPRASDGAASTCKVCRRAQEKRRRRPTQPCGNATAPATTYNPRGGRTVGGT
jgi:hypothetical protein